MGSHQCTPAPDYKPGDKVYLNVRHIQTNRPSRKLSHCRPGPFSIVKKVENGAYQLQLPLTISRLHLVFNMVKLTPAPIDPIKSCHPHPPLLPEIVDRGEEWIIEAILDSKMMNRKLCYLVKWEGFRVEHNSWEPWDNIHAPGLVADFHQKHPRAPHHIRTIDFNSIPFCSTPPFAVLGHHSLEGGGGGGEMSGDTRFHLQLPIPPTSDLTPFLTPLLTADSLPNSSIIQLQCLHPLQLQCYPLFTLPLFLHSYSPLSLPPSTDLSNLSTPPMFTLFPLFLL